MRALGAVAVVLALGSASCLAINPEHFQVRDTQDLVEVCSATGDDEHVIEALSFCHGFGQGAWHYHLATIATDGRFVCLPEPRPTRQAVLSQFASWAKDNPQFMNEPAVETLFKYLEQTFPCGK